MDLETFIPTEQDLRTLALRAYPGLEYSGICSAHREEGHFECVTCYPNYQEIIRGHAEARDELYKQLLALSGLKDPDNGRIGLNAILAVLKTREDRIKELENMLTEAHPANVWDMARQHYTHKGSEALAREWHVKLCEKVKKVLNLT